MRALDSVGFFKCSIKWIEKLPRQNAPKTEEIAKENLRRVALYCERHGVGKVVSYSTRRIPNIQEYRKGAILLVIRLENGEYLAKRHNSNQYLMLLK